ncbi:MAG: DUF1641 domain-containing protein [Planctomycetota bacterium]
MPSSSANGSGVNNAGVNGAATDQLQERLSDPRVAEGLNRLLGQLDTLSFALESVDGFLRRGDVIADSIGDSVRELKNGYDGNAADLLEAAPKLLKQGGELADAATAIDVEALRQSQILARLTEPETLDTVNNLLDQLPMLGFLVECLEGFLGRGEAIADNVADAVRELKLNDEDSGIAKLLPLLDAAPRMVEAAERLAGSELLGQNFSQVIQAGVSMIESGMLDERVVSTLGELGRQGADTFEEVASQEVKPVGGIFSLLRATSDPDVQHSLGFFFAFAKAFAKHLK